MARVALAFALLGAGCVGNDAGTSRGAVYGPDAGAGDAGSSAADATAPSELQESGADEQDSAQPSVARNDDGSGRGIEATGNTMGEPGSEFVSVSAGLFDACGLRVDRLVECRGECGIPL